MERVQRAQGRRRLGLGLKVLAGLLLLAGSAQAADFRGDRNLLDMRRAVWVEGELVGGHRRDDQVGAFFAATRLRVVEHLAARVETSAVRWWLTDGDRWVLGRAFVGVEGFGGLRLGESTWLRLGLAADVGTPMLYQQESDGYLDQPAGWELDFGWVGRLTGAARLEGERNWLQLQLADERYLVDEPEDHRYSGNPWPELTWRAALAFAVALDERRSLGADVTYQRLDNQVSLGTSFMTRPSSQLTWGVRLSYGEDFVLVGLVARHEP